jgi:hypothetical protein
LRQAELLYAEALAMRAEEKLLDMQAILGAVAPLASKGGAETKRKIEAIFREITGD